MSDFPPFPVDDATLLAVEHALGYYLTFEGENGETLDAPRGKGADYSLHELMDFLAGAMGTEGQILISGDPGAEFNGLGLGPDTPIYLDERIHYTEHDIIRSLITEVRRLRELEERQ